MKLTKRVLAVLLAGAMALALLAGCSGNGMTDVDTINIMLQLNGSEIKVTEDGSLKADAERYAALIRKLTPFEDSTEEVREENYEVMEKLDQEFPWNDDLNSTVVIGKAKRLILVSDSADAANDARRANEIAFRIIDLQKEKNLKIKSIAVVKVNDGRRAVWDEKGELTKVEECSMWVVAATYE